MDNSVININSIVSSRDYRPFVQLNWGSGGCQMTPDEAREHAYKILAAAEAAESDAFLVDFLREKVGLSTAVDVSMILQHFREFRENKLPINWAKLAKEGQNRTKI